MTLIRNKKKIKLIKKKQKYLKEKLKKKTKYNKKNQSLKLPSFRNNKIKMMRLNKF